MDLSLRRVLKDTQLATADGTLASHGIYYSSCESNIRKGTAMLIGQEGTPYFGGYYFFEIFFPAEYPFVPIQVKSLTQDGRTRFNPNMYKEGKVCLSILNTWPQGPQWSSIQNLGSVLLAIMSAVLNENPLENEPAYSGCGKSKESVAYNRLILSANFYTAIIQQLSKTPDFAKPFEDIMWTEFEKNRPKLLTICANAQEWDGTTDRVSVFQMSGTYDFKRASEGLQKLTREKIGPTNSKADTDTL